MDWLGSSRSSGELLPLHNLTCRHVRMCITGLHLYRISIASGSLVDTQQLGLICSLM